MSSNVTQLESKSPVINFWHKKLLNKIHPANLRLDFNRPAGHQNRYDSLEIILEQDLTNLIMNYTNSDPFLIYTVLMTGLTICLYKYCEIPDILLGSPAHKSYPGDAPVTVINSVMEKMNFNQLCSLVNSNLIESYKNQEYDVNELLQELSLEQVTNKYPLYDITLAMQNIHRQMPDMKNDIMINTDFSDDKIQLSFSFNLDLYKEGSIENFKNQYIQVLYQVMKNPGIVIADINYISDDEKHKLLYLLNNTETDYPRTKCIHQLFEEQAQKNPDAVALVCGEEQLTYQELNKKANQLANYLLKQGVKPDMLIGLFVDRSIKMIIGLLGVLKAGAAYVPLDPSYPEERLQHMIKNGNIKNILIYSAMHEKIKIENIHRTCLTNDWPIIARENSDNVSVQIAMNNLAYVIYTSGSTGVPKGTGVFHKGWTNLLNWFTGRFNINESDKNLIISSFSFDITQRAIAMALINGAELHLLNSMYYDPEMIVKTIEKEKITLMNCAPSTFYPLVEDKSNADFFKLHSLRWLFLGGEAISASRLKNWVDFPQNKTQIANVYGVAECTDVSSYHVLENLDQYIKSSVPIGRVINNSQIYVLDGQLKLVPYGHIGEVCIAGEGIGIGYINDEQLTTEKFVTNPFSDDKNEKLYRTGDLGRWNADGILEYVGRIDNQVKIRGLRIELGDIETCIRQHDSVKESVVICKEFSRNDFRILAYLVTETPDNEIAEQELKALVKSHLIDKLPAYMIPNSFFVLAELPLTPNGKVDRNALPVPSDIEPVAKTESDLPDKPDKLDKEELSELQVILHDIFAETLKKETVGLEDNFFEIGGHSIIATQLVSLVSQKLEIQLSPADLMTNPSVKKLTERIKEKYL